MTYTSRFQELLMNYKPGNRVELTDSSVLIQHMRFKSQSFFGNHSEKSDKWFVFNHAKENEIFKYPIFIHSKTKKTDQVILMLHGLNERNWNKYLSWAEYLCHYSGKAVVLFPIAYHMNRSPASWSNPRLLDKLLNTRRAYTGHDRSLSFANVALSERLSTHPELFYQSGRQSFDDIIKLIEEIKSGKHPLFYKNTHIDVFAYSIGAFLAQIIFLSNPFQYFSDARLFMFCGGGVFNSMHGTSRSIMDKQSFDTLFEFYQSGVWAEKETAATEDEALTAFYSMLTSNNEQTSRIEKFQHMHEQIKVISLKSDKVIPYEGVVQALGEECANQCMEVLDFPYHYTHENPFPIIRNTDSHAVDLSFRMVFDSAVEFLG